MAGLLKAMQAEKQVPGAVEVNVNPRFFEPLLELVMRLQRRGSTINDALRLLEFQSASILTKTRQFAQEAFGDAYDPIAAKLAIDVVEFLVAAAELPQGFVNVARTVLSSSPQPSAPGGKRTARCPRRAAAAGTDELSAERPGASTGRRIMLPDAG